MIEPNVVDTALSIAGQQLTFAVAHLEDGRAPMPSLWSFDGTKVKVIKLVVEDSDAAERVARRALQEELSGCESASLCTDIYVTDPVSWERTDALSVTVLKPGTDLEIRYVLPYERTEAGVAFPSAFRILAAAGLPDDYAATRLQDAVIQSVSGRQAARSALPTQITTAIDLTDTPAGSEDATGSRLLGQAALSVFSLVACADGEVDEKELHAFLAGITGQLGATRLLADATTRVLATGGLEVWKAVVARGPEVNLLLLAAVGHALDGLLGPDARAEKQALHDLGTAIASASGSWWRRIGREERVVLAQIAAVLRLV